VSMTPEMVNYLYRSDSGFRTNLLYCQNNNLYGFANYAVPISSSNSVSSGGIALSSLADGSPATKQWMSVSQSVVPDRSY
jgi:hypothetical protein